MGTSRVSAKDILVTVKAQSDQIAALQQQVAALLAVIAGEASATPLQPKAVEQVAPKAAPKVQDNSETFVFDGHKVTVVYETHKVVGWTIRKVTQFDGEAIKDWHKNARRTEINGLLPCSLKGCKAHRTGNSMFCGDHKAMQRDAYLQAKNAPKA